MEFTQSCFIRKNTPELRNKLEELGYTPNSYECFWDDDNRYLITFISPTGFDGFGLCITDCCILDNKSYIDCGTNENLFLAIAALRDDSDINQWFIYNTINNTVGKFETIEWVLCKDNNICDYLNWDNCYKYCHKATVEEIIEHFNKQ